MLYWYTDGSIELTVFYHFAILVLPLIAKTSGLLVHCFVWSKIDAIVAEFLYIFCKRGASVVTVIIGL